MCFFAWMIKIVKIYFVLFLLQTTILELKEEIAAVSGVASGLQHLLFRGRALRDDHVLSDYRILPYSSHARSLLFFSFFLFLLLSQRFSLNRFNQRDWKRPHSVFGCQTTNSTVNTKWKCRCTCFSKLTLGGMFWCWCMLLKLVSVFGSASDFNLSGMGSQRRQRVVQCLSSFSVNWKRPHSVFFLLMRKFYIFGFHCRSFQMLWHAFLHFWDVGLLPPTVRHDDSKSWAFCDVLYCV